MSSKIQIIIFDILMAITLLFYVEMHEIVHIRSCEYNGFNATRMSFTVVGCSGVQNDITPDIYNEIVASVFIPAILIIVSYVSLIRL